MLKRVLESREAIISTIAIMNAPVDIPNQNEWDIIKEACTVLEPFQQVTVEISAESYVTASKIILCRGLQTITNHHQISELITTEKVAELVTTLSSSMERRFHRMEYNAVLSDTSILDPRFKKLAFNESTAVDDAVQRLTTAAARCNPRSEPASPPSGQDLRVNPEPHTSTVWSFFDERASGDNERRNPSTDAVLEVRSYLEEPIIQRAADPLSWWKSKALVYPRLAKVMARKLCIVATSVPSERIFSKTGQIITERRNRISPNKVSDLVFLNANLRDTT